MSVIGLPFMLGCCSSPDHADHTYRLFVACTDESRFQTVVCASAWSTMSSSMALSTTCNSKQRLVSGMQERERKDIRLKAAERRPTPAAFEVVWISGSSCTGRIALKGAPERPGGINAAFASQSLVALSRKVPITIVLKPQSSVSNCFEVWTSCRVSDHRLNPRWVVA